MKKLKRYVGARGAARIIEVSHFAFRMWTIEGKAPEPDIIVNDHPAWDVKTIEKFKAEIEQRKLEKEREQ